jgi:hypothetical protein
MVEEEENNRPDILEKKSMRPGGNLWPVRPQPDGGHMEIERTSTPGNCVAAPAIERAGVPMFDAYSTAHPSPVG